MAMASMPNTRYFEIRLSQKTSMKSGRSMTTTMNNPYAAS